MVARSLFLKLLVLALLFCFLFIAPAQALTWGSSEQEELYGEIIYSFEEVDGVRVVTPWYTVKIPHEYAPQGVWVASYTELPFSGGEASGTYRSHRLDLGLPGSEGFVLSCYDPALHGGEFETGWGSATAEGFVTSDGLSVRVQCYPEAVPGGGWKMDTMDEATARAQLYATFVEPAIDPPAWASVPKVSAVDTGEDSWLIETPWYVVEAPSWCLVGDWAVSYRESLPPSFSEGLPDFCTHATYVVLEEPEESLGRPLRHLMICAVPRDAEMWWFSGGYQMWDTGVVTADGLRVWVFASYANPSYDGAEAQWVAKMWSSFVRPAGVE